MIENDCCRNDFLFQGSSSPDELGWPRSTRLSMSTKAPLAVNGVLVRWVFDIPVSPLDFDGPGAISARKWKITFFYLNIIYDI